MTTRKIDRRVKVNMVTGSLTKVYFEPVRGAVRPIARIELIGSEWRIWGEGLDESSPSRSDAVAIATRHGEAHAAEILAEFEEAQ